MQSNANDKPNARGNGPTSTDKPASAAASPFSIWRIPPPVQRLFNRFPLRLYPPCELPLSAPRHRNRNALYIFTTASDAAIAAPSFNPGCLKWQTLLSFAHIPYQPVPSSNHASPSGALPFLIPGTTAQPPPTASLPPSPYPVPTSKLESWIRSNTEEAVSVSLEPRHAAYTTLLSHSIRLAYLYALYLHPSTFRSVASPLYLESSSSNTLVQLSLEGPLRAAALSELMTLTSGPIPTTNVEQLLTNADEAFEALSTLLNDAQWFTAPPSSPNTDVPISARKKHRTAQPAHSESEDAGATYDADDPGDRQRSSEVGLFDDEADDERTEDSSPAGPGVLDASLFAYTHVILSLFADQAVDSPARRLYEAVSQRQNLVEHRVRILHLYYPAYVASERRVRSRGGGAAEKW